MRPLGPAGAPLLLADAGSGAQLRTGVSVSVTVLERLSPGRYAIVAGGLILRARTDAVLQPGSVLRARVERADGGPGLVLRLLPDKPQAAGLQDGLDALLARSGLQADAAGRLAAAALLTQGEAAAAGALARVRKAVLDGRASAALEDGDKDAEDRARLAARMEAKGLGATADAVDLLLGLSGDPGNRL